MAAPGCMVSWLHVCPVAHRAPGQLTYDDWPAYLPEWLARRTRARMRCEVGYHARTIHREGALHVPLARLYG
ncbi:hypothetical protein BCEP27_11659 [Burkholderia cepacia]